MKQYIGMNYFIIEYWRLTDKWRPIKWKFVKATCEWNAENIAARWYKPTQFVKIYKFLI